MHLKKVFLQVIMILALVITIVGCRPKDYMEEAIQYIDGKMSELGFEDGDRFVLDTTYQNVSITWESTDTVINSEGLVNTTGLTTDIQVKIIVTFVEDDQEEMREYYVTVYYTPVVDPNPDPDPDLNEDEAKIKLVKENLVLATEVMEDFELITSSNGVSITWESNHAAISNTGEVTRSLTEDVTVTLTATFTSGEESDTKVFTVIVKQIHVLDEGKDALVIDTSVTEDMILPTTIGETYVIQVTWSSDNAAISHTGEVTRSLTEDVTVNLTATLSFEGETVTKEFAVVVLQDTTLSEAVDGLLIDEIVVRDLVLVTEIGDVTVSWSSNNAAISNTGEVTRSLTEDIPVTLVATLTYEGTSVDKTFNLTVKVEPSQQLPTPVGFVWQSDFNFFAYASYTAEGYGGSLIATFTAEGYDTIVYENISSGGQFSISAIIDQFEYNVEYMATFIAVADGINYSDSEPTGPIGFTIPIVLLDAPTNLVITEGVLTWDAVADATSYEIYTKNGNANEVLFATVLSTDALSVTLPVELGNYQVKVIATADGRGDNSAVINYIVAAEELTALDAPVISLDSETNIISWDAISNANGYEIQVNDLTVSTNETSFDLINITNAAGTYNVVVVAKGDYVYYSNSTSSNSVEYTITQSLTKVDSSGLLIQANVVNNGHYAIEKPANFNPEGWVTGQYIIEIYQGDTLVRTGNYDNGGTVVFFQYPNDANGLLYGLTPGQYTAHFIMVGNQTTHLNSDPAIFVFDFAGY